MATALLSGADPDEVLRAVSTQVSALTDADMAGVLSPSVDDEHADDRGGVGTAADDIEGVRIPWTGTYLGALHAGRGASADRGHQHRCPSSASARPRS